MKTLFLSLLILVFWVPTSWANDTYSLEVIKQPDQRWQFRHLTINASGETTLVKGRLTAVIKGGLPRGHVDLAAYSPSGKLIAETTTTYVPSMLTQTIKRKGGVRFSARFDQPLPADSIVKVAFHRAKPRISVNPSHKENIAR